MSEPDIKKRRKAFFLIFYADLKKIVEVALMLDGVKRLTRCVHEFISKLSFINMLIIYSDNKSNIINANETIL